MSSDGEDRGMEITEGQSGALSVIAQPLASGKLHKRLLKLTKKAAKAKTLKRGVKETVKAIRKSVKGLVVLAGDISPIDVLTHMPVLCEEAAIPYVYVPSKAELGAAGLTRRPTCCLMVPMPKSGDAADLLKYYEKCAKEMKNLGAAK